MSETVDRYQCEDCGRVFLTPEAFNGHGCHQNRSNATVPDGGESFPFVLEVADRNRLPDRLSEETITLLAREAVLDAVDGHQPAIEAATLFLLGTDSNFRRPTMYDLAKVYDLEMAQVWQAYHELRGAIDRKSAIALALERIQYEVAAREIMDELKDEGELAFADGGRDITSCDHCRGRGFVASEGMKQDCPVCGGSGKLQIVPDGGLPRETRLRQDLTKFQIRTLAVLAERGPTHGLDIKAGLEEYYGSDVNHGLLYPNLDELVELGLIKKHEYAVDRRTHTFEISEEGRDHLRETVMWLGRRLDAGRDETFEQVKARADGGEEGGRDE